MGGLTRDDLRMGDIFVTSSGWVLIYYGYVSVMLTTSGGSDLNRGAPCHLDSEELDAHLSRYEIVEKLGNIIDSFEELRK